MKMMTIFAMLALAGIAWSGTTNAQEYNLRTVPATPQAGAPFVAAFDDTDCVDWMLLPDAEPPVVTVQGSIVRLEVDRITVANCSNQPRTNTLSVPALPPGTHQMELIGRAYLSPGNDLLVQTITFQVTPAVGASNFTIPVNSKVALAILAGLMLSLGYALSHENFFCENRPVTALSCSATRASNALRQRRLRWYSASAAASIAASATGCLMKMDTRLRPSD